MPIPSSSKSRNDNHISLPLANATFRIANYGADAFYTGKIATNTAEAAFARGGILTTHDLANYSAIVRTPVNISKTTPLPSIYARLNLYSVP